MATITETKNRLSALIDRVRGGESVLIVDRGIPVARLESVVTPDGDTEGRIARLARSGAVRAAKKPPSIEAVSGQLPRPGRGATAVHVLLEERRTGR